MESNDLMKSKEILSVAVKIGKDTTLYKLNQGLPLQMIIKELCEERNIEYIPNYYALQITDTKEGNINKYVTEENRYSYITNASELRLIYSATEMCKMIHEKIISEDELEWTLEKLSSLSKDKTFSEEFVAKYGINTLVSLMQKAKPPYEMIHLCLEALLSFYSFNLITSFDNIPLECLINFVVSSRTVPEEVTEHSLHFLKNMLTSKKVPANLSKCINNKISIDDVITFLQSKYNSHLQEKALAYLNVLLLSDTNDSCIISQLESRKVREIIWKNIVMNSIVSQGMAHELFIFQSIFLKDLTSKLNTYIEAHSDEAMHLQELHNIDYSNENHFKRDSVLSFFEEHSSDKLSPEPSASRSSAYESDAEKYHFPLVQMPKSENEDEDEKSYTFCRSQSLDISVLTLNCMQYFSRKKLKTFMKVKLMEEKVQKKPFHSICDRLVHLLCDALQVNQEPAQDCTCYQPLIFEATKESPFFEELFCRVAVRLSATSKEMKARTSQDHDKVMKVLHHQVTSVLNKQLQSWKKFEEELQNITYEKVVESWQSTNDQNLMKLQDLPAVIEFRESLKAEIEEVIAKHRLHLLCQGTKFLKANLRPQKIKKRFWYIYLSPNYTVFHYGDCGESESEDIECSSKMSVSSIKELLVGRKCPHVRENKNNRKTEPEFAFSLMLDQEEPASLDFIAPNQQIYDYWTDGLSHLLGTKMKSKSMETDLKMLLDMEVRLHLLELEGLDIPHDTPIIPEGPSCPDVLLE
ncbi:hypothetical protein R5R35_009371 [Gryllus longicercus]|uniref:Engulfment and cell motility protein 1 n=1 Tax=Gryllus longicercus TaxID=2509291 RepID=A0AAN9YW63_9ORTH